jgi:hypothetical protein
LQVDWRIGPLLVSLLFSVHVQPKWRRKLMTTTATLNVEDTTAEHVLFLAFELSEKTWKLAFTTGPGHKPRERGISARNQMSVLREITQAKKRFGLPETAPVVSCDEAGREGFWLHRFLQAQGIANSVVESEGERCSLRAGVPVSLRTLSVYWHPYAIETLGTLVCRRSCRIRLISLRMLSISTRGVERRVACASFGLTYSRNGAITPWTKYRASRIVVVCHPLNWVCLSLPKRWDVLFLPE